MNWVWMWSSSDFSMHLDEFQTLISNTSQSSAKQTTSKHNYETAQNPHIRNKCFCASEKKHLSRFGKALCMLQFLANTRWWPSLCGYNRCVTQQCRAKFLGWNTLINIVRFRFDLHFLWTNKKEHWIDLGRRQETIGKTCSDPIWKNQSPEWSIAEVDAVLQVCWWFLEVYVFASPVHRQPPLHLYRNWCQCNLLK